MLRASSLPPRLGGTGSSIQRSRWCVPTGRFAGCSSAYPRIPEDRVQTWDEDVDDTGKAPKSLGLLFEGALEAEQVVEVAEPTPPQGEACGSAGHPEFCRRPCLFFLAGQCNEGSSGKYCHERHGRVRKMHSKLRQTIQNLSNLDRLAVLHDSLACRTRQLSPAHAHLDGLIQLIADALQNERDSHASASSSAASRRMVKASASLCYWQLFAHFCTHCKQEALSKMPVAAQLGGSIAALSQLRAETACLQPIRLGGFCSEK